MPSSPSWTGIRLADLLAKDRQKDRITDVAPTRPHRRRQGDMTAEKASYRTVAASSKLTGGL